VPSVASAWCVVQTRGQCERAVADSLVARNIECFLPMERVRRIVRGKAETVDRPLYPNYLFATFENEYDRHEIRRGRYVTDILLVRGDRAQHRLASDIESLRLVLGIDPLADVTDWAREGRDVVVVRGSFTGARGRIVRRDRRVKDHTVTKDVLTVGVPMLGRVVELEIDPAFCEPV
jgi:transcription antitermination factor NusG